MAKKKPMKRPAKGGTPKRITTKGKPGDTGPGGARPARGWERGGPKRSVWAAAHSEARSGADKAAASARKPKVASPSKPRKKKKKKSAK